MESQPHTDSELIALTI